MDSILIRFTVGELVLVRNVRKYVF